MLGETDLSLTNINKLEVLGVVPTEADLVIFLKERAVGLGKIKG